MTLVKKPKAQEPVKSDFETKYDKMISELNSQTAAVKDLTARIDKLIESDKKVHDTVDPKTDPEPEPEKPDVTDKVDEQEDKIKDA